MSAEGRVENQKLNQTAALLSFGWVFGFQLDLLEKYLVTLPELTFTLLNMEGRATKFPSANNINALPVNLKPLVFL